MENEEGGGLQKKREDECDEKEKQPLNKILQTVEATITHSVQLMKDAVTGHNDDTRDAEIVGAAAVEDTERPKGLLVTMEEKIVQSVQSVEESIVQSVQMVKEAASAAKDAATAPAGVSSASNTTTTTTTEQDPEDVKVAILVASVQD